jgi:tetratricopeptide (TPR) repeat protein
MMLSFSKKLVKQLNFFVIVCSVFILGTVPQALAQQESASAEQQKPARKTRRTQTMREQIYKRLEAVQKLADEKDYAGALSKLDALNKLKRNSYEQAMTWNMYAYVYFNQEDFKKAANAYEEIVAIKNVPLALEENTLYSLAKLYLIEENYKKSLSTLNKWFAIKESPGAEAYILRAQIYYQLEQYAKALPEVKKAVKIFVDQGKKPRESWLLLERAVYYQNKDYKAMERCLKDLIRYYPKGEYWVQLSAVYNELGKPKKELSAMEAAYEQGVLTKEMELVSLAQALLSQETPYKAAQVLLQGMQDGIVEKNAKNLSLLGDALMIAKEYDEALEVMQQAAEKSQKGQDFYKVAQIQTERQMFKQALANVNKAMKLGDLRSEKNAITLKGLLLFNLKRLNEASVEFEKLAKIEGSEQTAKQWLDYIASEQRRLEYIESQ